MPDARVKWEWTFSPQTVFSGLNFLVLLLGLIGVWFQMRADVSSAKDSVTKLETAVARLLDAQTVMVERMTKVETKVDVMLPLLQQVGRDQRQPTR